MKTGTGYITEDLLKKKKQQQKTSTTPLCLLFKRAERNQVAKRKRRNLELIHCFQQKIFDK